MMSKLTLLVSALALTFVVSPGYAATSKPQSAASIQCSKQADSKGLHGKERKAFREQCKKTAAHKPAAPKAK